MSHLKDIMLELHNCLHEFEPEDDVPMVWSREFQQKLARNASHWNDDQRRASHVSNMDFQDEEDANIGIPYGDDSAVRSAPSAEARVGATFDFDYEDDVDGDLDIDLRAEAGDFKTKYGQAYRMWKTGNPEGDLESAEIGGANRFGGIAALLGSVGEEEEEDEVDTETNSVKGVKIGGNLNITDDPDKVARAKKLRDRARKVRDEAKEKREEAKAKQAGEEGDLEGDVGDREENEDPDLQGTIRAVPNSHLVYKRQQEDGTFDELWHYNIGDDFKKELKIRRAILAGTDIPINKMKSPDGSQTYELWTIGNGQMLKVQGLPN